MEFSRNFQGISTRKRLWNSPSESNPREWKTGKENSHFKNFFGIKIWNFGAFTTQEIFQPFPKFPIFSQGGKIGIKSQKFGNVELQTLWRFHEILEFLELNSGNSRNSTKILNFKIFFEVFPGIFSSGKRKIN